MICRRARIPMHRMASPQLAEQKAEVKETDLPKETPTESEDPDRIVTTNKSKKPKEDDPKIAAVQTPASQESVAQEATARQTLDENAPEARRRGRQPGASARTSRSSPPIGAARSAPISSCTSDIRRTKSKDDHGQGEPRAQPPRQRGIRRRSRDLSGDAAFDEAALSMIRRSDPVPVPPAGLTDDQFSFSLDVNFKNRSKLWRGALRVSRHGRARPGHPRLLFRRRQKDVDGRDKPGHDDNAA